MDNIGHWSCPDRLHKKANQGSPSQLFINRYCAARTVKRKQNTFCSVVVKRFTKRVKANCLMYALTYLNLAILTEMDAINVGARLRNMGDDLEARRLANVSRCTNLKMCFSGVAVCLGLLLLGTTVLKRKQ